MRSQHIWTERSEDGKKREVRATKFGGVWRLQAKTVGDLAEEIILALHEPQVVDLEVAGGEVIVPHQRQAFLERMGRKEAAVEPPGLEPFGASRIDRRLPDDRRQRFETFGNSFRASLAFDEASNGGFGPVAQIALDLLPRRREHRSPMEVHHPLEVPGDGVGWFVGRPGHRGWGIRH